MFFDFDDKFDIHPTVYIAPGARLYGRVTIGAHSSVWDGAVIRGDMAPITIGENTSIQENCTVHVDTDTPTHIGNNVTVGHGAVVHGATIGDNCIIAIQSAVLNDAMVEHHSVVGAGAIVMEGKTIPAFSVAFGIPAKVVRTLAPDAADAIQKNADDYVKLAAGYLNKRNR